eukprot:TRINITY_DN8_c0_g3_i1.p1 TRINITY_DN8_c0_g3~~TRINITY_DN8_c0_g3_i1.p1  ORF type:complete len:983 (-),score=224.07 TRINITY_DN8_c0_g3_i1:822-3770(-)
MNNEQGEAMKAATLRIIVLVDSTGSMGSFCTSVGSTLKQLLAVLDVLFEGKALVSIVSYTDYCEGKKLLEVCEPERGDASVRKKLSSFASLLRPTGGGDAPEAVKTALGDIHARLLQYNKQEAGASERTLVIHYTDAPPHHKSLTGSHAGTNLPKEMEKLKGATPGFDWVQICKAFKALGTTVITFLQDSIAVNSMSSAFYQMLGPVVLLPRTDPGTITRSTMGVLLQTMGQPAEKRGCIVSTVALENLGDENSEDFEKLADGLKRGQVKEDYEFPAIDAFKRDLRILTTRFSNSTDFQDLVFSALKDLFVPECVLAITYNSVLGLLWRLVCKRREDERVQPLCDALSSCCQALAGESQTQLRTWIDESYNQVEEIREIVEKIEKPLNAGVLILDVSKHGELPSKDEMRSILHSPTPGVLKKVQALLSRLVCVTTGALPHTDVNGEDAPMYIPMELPDKQIFMLLSHLLLPGMMTSLRPAAMFAIMTYLSGNEVLRPVAERFLKAVQGAWIPPIEKVEDFPEILNGEFVRLVNRVPEFLTEAEKKLYEQLGRILRVRRAANLRVPLKVPFTPNVRELRPDFKERCACCGTNRSTSHMIDGTCCFCKLPDDDRNKTAVEPSESMSHIAECRSCKSHYAVVNLHNLNVTPKCWYCRNGQECPTTSCTKCQNKFVLPTATHRVAAFVCACCVSEPEKGIADTEATFSELCEGNTGMITCLGVAEKARTAVFDKLGLYKLWQKHEADLNLVEESRLDVLKHGGKPILNVSEVFDFVVEQALHGRLASLCNLCFEDRPVGLVHSACGRCKNLACTDCLGSWYGQLKPGGLYVPSEGLCAFCKRVPKAATLRTYNRNACRLMGRAKLELRADMYYGWCLTCFRVKEALPRDCAGEAPELRAFECDDCKATKVLAKGSDALEKNTKQCPQCHIPTIKLSGCDHMSCPCGAHWCWKCTKQCSEEDIYEHLDAEHGGIGIDYDSDFSDEEP